MVSSALCKNQIINVVIFVFHIFTVWDLRDWTVPLGTSALCLWVVLEDSCLISNFLLPHWLLDPLGDLGLLQDQFPCISIPSYFCRASDTHFLHISLMMSNHLLSGFPTDPFSSRYS